MTGSSSRVAIRNQGLVPLALFAFSATTWSCTDVLAPALGQHYVLRTVNGLSLPTPLFPQQPPDTAYAAIVAEEIVFTSDTQFSFSAWYARAHVQQAGGVVYDIVQCWQNYTFNYKLNADTVFSGSAQPFQPNPPSVPPILLLRANSLIAPYDIQGAPNQYHYAVGERVVRNCG